MKEHCNGRVHPISEAKRLKRRLRALNFLERRIANDLVTLKRLKESNEVVYEEELSEP
jgi:hypothetical protein